MLPHHGGSLKNNVICFTVELSPWAISSPSEKGSNVKRLDLLSTYYYHFAILCSFLRKENYFNDDTCCLWCGPLPWRWLTITKMMLTTWPRTQFMYFKWLFSEDFLVLPFSKTSPTLSISFVFKVFLRVVSSLPPLRERTQWWFQTFCLRGLQGLKGRSSAFFLKALWQ